MFIHSLIGGDYVHCDGKLNRDFEKAIQCIYDKFIKEEGEQL